MREDRLLGTGDSLDFARTKVKVFLDHEVG
jgi:hypothetical protein